MAKERFQRLPADVQRRILAVAAAEFAANGFRDASFNQIIARAEVSKGAMYYYFEDKADLFSTILTRAWTASGLAAPALGAAQTAAEFWEAVRVALAQLSDLATSQPRIFELLRLGLDDDFDGWATWLESALAAGARVGALRRELPQELALAWAHQLIIGFDQWSNQESKQFSLLFSALQRVLGR